MLKTSPSSIRRFVVISTAVAIFIMLGSVVSAQEGSLLEPAATFSEAPLVEAPVLEAAPEAAIGGASYLQAEPLLYPNFLDHFDAGLSAWSLGAGWSQVASEGGLALQVVNSTEPATFIQGESYDVAAQARFLLNAGSAGIRVRQSAVGSYTATLNANGQVTLSRADTVIGATVVPLYAGQWQTLRVSATGDVLRVAVNGVEVLAVQDVAGLPPGTVAIVGSLESAPLLVDDFGVWSLTGAVPTLNPIGSAAEGALSEGAAGAEIEAVSFASSGPGNGNGNGNGNGHGNQPTGFQVFNGNVKVKVLTIVMLEVGELTGDFAGEAQRWIEGEGLYRVVQFPGGFSPAYCNRDDHCLIITGVGFSNAASSVMAAGLHPKLDLSQAYILVAGIAGVDPQDGTLGSAAWANWVVDGDLAHHIDARELPANFQYPMFRLNCYTDQYCADGRTWGVEVYQLNSRLVDWAYRLTQNLTLEDSPAAQATRSNYPANLPASQPPSVIRCDSLGSSTYWHGQRLSDWANWWVGNWTGGAGNYCMTNQEDASTMTALRRLADAGLVDFNRVFVLRTASNFDQPYPGQDIMASLGSISGGFVPSVSNAYLVGSTVTDYIIANWHQWRHGVPPLP